MRTSSLSPSLCLVCALSASLAHAQPFPETNDFNAPYRGQPPFLLEKVSVPEANLLLDDHILELSRVCRANIIVDVTRLDPKQRIGAFPASIKAQATTGAQLRVRVNLLSDFEEVTRTTKLPFDKNTFLLWDQADAKVIAQLIVKLGKDKPVEKPPGDRELRAALRPFVPDTPFETLTDAQRLALEKRGTYKLGQFSPQIQAWLIALARQSASRPELHLSRFFDDDFWKSVRIRREETGSTPGLTLSPDDGKDAPRFSMDFPDILELPNPERPYAMVRPPDPPEPQAGEVSALAPAPAPAPAYEANEKPGYSWRELNGEDALLAKVSLQAKRQPLRTLLASIAKQSGVALKAAPTVPADALVTLGVQEMPLSTLMTALARTFNLAWTKSANSWTCSDDGRDELHHLLDRSRARVAFAPFQADVSSDERIDALMNDVDAQFDAPEVDAAAGIAFSSLPAPLQKRVRDEFEFRASVYIRQGYDEAFVFLTPDSLVSLSWGGLGDSMNVFVQPATHSGGGGGFLRPTAEEHDAFYKKGQKEFDARTNAHPETEQQPEPQPVDANDNQ